MKIKLKQDEEGNLKRMWVNDKEIPDCKLVSLSANITDKKKILKIYFNLKENFIEEDFDLIVDFHKGDKKNLLNSLKKLKDKAEKEIIKIENGLC